MAVLLTAPATTGTSGYTLLIADAPDQIAAAQRLRHRVFGEELGATLHSLVPGTDVDEFDAHCDHLIVRADATGEVVGTYRMLPPRGAAATGRRYADGEFDTSALAPLRDHLVETGRSCVDPAHRSGAVINLMWAGIARYLHLHGLRWLGGCASVPLADGGATAAGVRALARAKHMSPPRLRVRPHQPWLPADGVEAPVRVAVPPLLRGYLRLGAWVCGEPAHDRDFDVADFYVLLSLDRVDPRYLRHFLGDAALDARGGAGGGGGAGRLP
ncbi:GNAT family N-acetyltransferase [Rhizomonospora bruguierae]|uniref:GNAT family N-acetyltransferase n=1 Tax=Rhizomonospora bruguierae TaxID=1581705 RepID=UPI001BCC953A|nr:GNAT family N-acyltransferase [Micromonospora sp. NBRC 107566]